jgi:hypothetical protein
MLAVTAAAFLLVVLGGHQSAVCLSPGISHSLKSDWQSSSLGTILRTVNSLILNTFRAFAANKLAVIFEPANRMRTEFKSAFQALRTAFRYAALLANQEASCGILVRLWALEKGDC